jgi:hypothetical protein
MLTRMRSVGARGATERRHIKGGGRAPRLQGHNNFTLRLWKKFRMVEPCKSFWNL